MKPDDFLLISTTCPDEACADTLANTLVEQNLAACVQIIPGVRSVYRWKGNIEHDEEVLVTIKARAADFEAIAASVKALHPYELPEVIALPMQAASQAYMQWMIDSTT